MTITYGSVCSGIEAATVGWSPLGWVAEWFSEIERFPSALLAQRYPNVPNLGDMTGLAKRLAAGEVSAPKILVGATPCQSFSVAGLRGSLDDDRGNLTLEFIKILEAMDDQRRTNGLGASVAIWENVPGILNTSDNAFGGFLGGLAGHGGELQPPDGRKWGNAGYIAGPKRAVGWRVFDAQYFGLAQRRKRVFLVASADPRVCPATILFEREGVRRDTPPRREAGQNIAPAVTCGPPFSRTGNTRVELDAPCHTLAASADAPVMAFPERMSATQAATTEELAPVLQSTNPTAIVSADAVQVQWASGGGQLENNMAQALQAGAEHNYQFVRDGYTVRRLLPIECERLMGFPDGYTAINEKRKARPEWLHLCAVKYMKRMTRRHPGYDPVLFYNEAMACPDTPRYKALGNSKPTVIMNWIGRRIDAALKAEEDAA